MQDKHGESEKCKRAFGKIKSGDKKWDFSNPIFSAGLTGTRLENSVKIQVFFVCFCKLFMQSLEYHSQLGAKHTRDGVQVGIESDFPHPQSRRKFVAGL